jgi:carbonic anhydrase
MIDMQDDHFSLSKILLAANVVLAVVLIYALLQGTGPIDWLAKTGPAGETAETHGTEAAFAKPSPDQVLQMLKAGNERFAAGQAIHPNADAARFELAGKENQGKYAYATVLGCSDSRVPVELIFDAGVMDIFVVRVAGNVTDIDEIGSIEYGLAHVHTPLLVVMGHTRCGAVTAASQAVQGKALKLERNIPPLLEGIVPAVKRAMEQHPDLHGDELIPYAVEENVWQSVEDLFLKSPAVRKLVKDGKAKVVGAVYDVGTGKVNWLDPEKADKILAYAEASDEKETEAYGAD